ncbi:MAG: transglutaminase-like domain-containing protein [Thermoplasmatota archaeon]
MNRKIIISGMMLLIVLGTIPFFFILLDKPEVDRYERTLITFQVDVGVRNLGNSPAVDIPLRLALPMDDLHHQRIISLDISRLPQRESNDTWGNRFVHYTISQVGPGEVFNLTLNVTVELISIDTEVKSSQKEPGPGENEELSKFLLESSLINVNDPSIIDLARDIAGRSSRIDDVAWNTYEWILDNIFYQQVPGEWDAVTTLRNGEGGSAEMANLFVALMRANGIPARRISGWGNFFEKGEELSITRFSHGWAEFYVPGQGWVQVDPAWGKTSKFDNFARTDADHVILTKGADIKFLWRGPFTTPFGDTEVKTDYYLKVIDKQIENISPKREIIKWSILSVPLIFVAFILVRLIKIRRV